VPVPIFLLFLCFRKGTQEIFSKLDETKKYKCVDLGVLQTSDFSFFCILKCTKF
jgi:hypothetical protein